MQTSQAWIWTTGQQKLNDMAGTLTTVRIAFPEMLDCLPSLRSKLVGVLADRIRETTRADEQRETLMALGRLSAAWRTS